MKYDNKCPNCGANMTFNSRTGPSLVNTCNYCGFVVTRSELDDPETLKETVANIELDRLVKRAKTHCELKDYREFSNDVCVMYKQYPDKPETYYYQTMLEIKKAEGVSDKPENYVYQYKCISKAKDAYDRLTLMDKNNKIEKEETKKKLNMYIEYFNDRNTRYIISRVMLYSIIPVLLIIASLFEYSMFFLAIPASIFFFVKAIKKISSNAHEKIEHVI